MAGTETEHETASKRKHDQTKGPADETLNTHSSHKSHVSGHTPLQPRTDKHGQAQTESSGPRTKPASVEKEKEKRKKKKQDDTVAEPVQACLGKTSWTRQPSKMDKPEKEGKEEKNSLSVEKRRNSVQC